MPDYVKPWSRSSITPADVQQYMRLAFWPLERIEEAFDDLEDDEIVTVVAGDFIVIRNAKNEERRFYMVPQVVKKSCPTCGREL